MGLRRAFIGILPAVLFLLAGAEPLELSPEELIRRANAAFDRDDLSDAERLYQDAELSTGDPGLVAFNRATVLFHRAEAAQSGLYVEAARQYALVLSDASCPPERAARAWYNRGTCLLRQPGAGTAMYRSAIACLERCLDSPAADPLLRASAAYNLKLAKLLWNEARKKERSEDNPNLEIPPEDPRSEPPPESPSGFDRQTGDHDPGDGNTGAQLPKVVPQHAMAAGMKAGPAQGQSPATGATGHRVLSEDLRDIRSLSPEETRERLRRTGERLLRDQRIMRMTLYGAERTGLHDW